MTTLLPWGFFHLLCEPGPGEGERWVTGCVIEHRVTLKSLPCKEITISLLEAIQHLDKRGANLHNLHILQMMASQRVERTFLSQPALA